MEAEFVPVGPGFSDDGSSIINSSLLRSRDPESATHRPPRRGISHDILVMGESASGQQQQGSSQQRGLPRTISASLGAALQQLDLAARQAARVWAPLSPCADMRLFVSQTTWHVV